MYEYVYILYTYVVIHMCVLKITFLFLSLLYKKFVSSLFQ